MKLSLEDILKSVGLPVALAAVIASVAALLGLPLDRALELFGVLFGLQYVIALIVDLLKGVGVVKPGTSGQWSAGLNLVAIIGLSVLLKFYPDVTVQTWDAQLLELAKAVVLIVTWLMQLFGTKGAHHFYGHVIGIKSFRFANAEQA